MEQRFVAGQRWISEAEPDLGLGSVEAVEGRRVQVVFAASGETRTYAMANAPLVRALFAVDDAISDQSGNSLRITALQPAGDLIEYLCVDEAGNPVTLPEHLLNDHLRLNRPQDKLLARRIDPDVWFTLRYQGWLRTAAMWRSPVFGLAGPRIDLVPHQLYIASEVAARAAPRVLLADEVGLGKTIEAGLILHRLLMTERVQRVLVVLPDALVNQWLVEMLRRFNLRFAVFDAERFAEADTDAGNLFESEQRVLCNLSLLTADADVARAARESHWDLLIVDEAHHLEWHEQGHSEAYALVEVLAAQTPSVLLLTATPEQLGRAGHFGRLRLLDPQRFHSYTQFVAEEEAYAAVAAVASDLLDGRVPDAAGQALLDTLLGEEAQHDSERVIERLIDRHGTGRVLFRNTRHAIKGFPQRRLHTYALDLPAVYGELTAQPTPERDAGGDWVEVDPRVAWLRDLLRALAPEKVLVICAHAATAIALRDFLLERCAIHAAMFHERMEIVARDRAAAFFADPDEGSQVLVCSEIGSEGRNFQFAHHLVLFDLPLDPDLLEQRIGRLDRIGQRATIELHVPYLVGGASEVLLRWYRDGLGSFESVCPAASAVYAELGERLAGVLRSGAEVDALIDAAATLTADVNRALESGRDRLLEMHSHVPKVSAHLVQQLRECDDVEPLRAYLDAYWDAFGLEHEAGPGHSVILRPGAHMLNDHYPGLGDEPVTLTFERGDALAHEDRLFLTWEHPMVRGSIDLLSSGELGSAAITVCSHPDFRAGHALLEVLYVVECSAPRGLELQRYLPPTCVRYVLDGKGEDHAARLPHESLQGLCLAKNRKLADTVIKSQSARIKPLLQLAAERAEQAANERVTQASRAMQAELQAELERLQALARVNPNVRNEEIAQLVSRRERIAQQLQHARVRLDALRIIVMR